MSENLTGAMIGTNTFQVRRTPISVGLLDDEQVRAIAKRPLVTVEDAEPSRRARPRRARPWRSSRAGRRRWATSRYRDRDGRQRAHLRRHPALPGGPGLQLRRRRAAHRSRRQRAPAGRRARLRDRRQAVRRPARRGRQAGPARRARGDGEGRDRPEGTRCWASRSTASCCCPFSTFEAIYGRRKTTVVSVKMRDRRGDRRRHGARRGGDADRPPAPARRGRTTSRSTRPTRWSPSGRQLTSGALHRDPRRGLRSASWSAASSS